MKTAVLFVAHFLNEDTLARYLRLRQELPKDRYDFVPNPKN